MRPAVLLALFARLQGLSRFLVEIIRLNDEVVLGLSQPQLWSLALFATGAVITWMTLRGSGGRSRNRVAARATDKDAVMEMSGAMTVIGIVMMAAMLAVIAWAAVAALRGARRRTPESSGARSVLDERLAAGEIDEEEYERRRRTLERSGS